jgi:eukaryotic-like serine/threonine-protein kinase
LSPLESKPSDSSLSSDEASDEIDDFLREAAAIPRSARPADPDRSGERLGHYQLEAKIGEGGMGVVYAARDTRLGRSVALKLLPRAVIGDPSRRKRLLREARAAAAITHGSIATIYEAGEIDGDVFLAMEKIEGRNLRACIVKGRVPIDEALRVIQAIAEGLAHAHDKGIVHRDVKPENVMLLEGGAVKVLDFGLAKLGPAAPEAGESDLATRAGGLLGTPSYMSPEQAKGHAVGPPGDVFALGIVLYELLTGKRPFVGVSAAEVFIAIDRDQPALPSRVNPQVPVALERLVMRCLAKNPAHRFQDGRELSQAITAFLSGPRTSPWRKVVFFAAALAGITLGAWLLLAPPATNSATELPAPIEAEVVPSTNEASESAVTVEVARRASPTSQTSISAPSASASASASAPLRPAGTARTKPSAKAAIDPLARQK